MYQPQNSRPNISIQSNRFDEHPRIDIFDKKHWRYIQKRYYISPRELEVAKLICYGLNNDQIASDLKIKHGTVKTHIRNIYRRIHVNNKIEMLLRFLEDATIFSSNSDTAGPTPVFNKKKTPSQSS